MSQANQSRRTSIERALLELESSSTADADALVGERLGPYVLEGLLGRGGNGVVFRATDSRLSRPVALKALREAGSANEEARRRFLREVESCSTIFHPNVARVYDAGEDAGVLYMAMELIEGETLRRKIVDGGLPLLYVVRLAQQIAAGLAAAHRRGVVHRDLKPENVMIQPDRRPVILDFGLARVELAARGEVGGAEEEGGLDDTPDATVLTREGEILGTPAYMSPEQATGRAVGPPSDVYAFGTLLYEMLTGDRPFTDEGPVVELLMAIARDAPIPLELLRPDVPPPVADLVRDCMAKDPADRPSQGGALLVRTTRICRDLGADPLESGEVALSRGSSQAPASGSHLKAYLSGLPDGLDSYPGYTIKAAVLRAVLGDLPPSMNVDTLPAPLRELVASPPPSSLWVPEAKVLAFLMAVYDCCFTDDDAYLTWVADHNRSMLAGPLYRALFFFVSPAMLVRAMGDRWGRFHQGIVLDGKLVGDKALEVTATYPAGLANRLHALNWRDVAVMSLEAAGAKEVELELVRHSPTELRIEGTWS